MAPNSFPRLHTTRHVGYDQTGLYYWNSETCSAVLMPDADAHWSTAPRIVSIDPGGVAALDARLECGDGILAVNGSAGDAEELSTLLRQATGPFSAQHVVLAHTAQVLCLSHTFDE